MKYIILILLLFSSLLVQSQSMMLSVEQQQSISIVAVTQDMTLDATWDVLNAPRGELSEINNFSARIDLNLNSSDEGLIFEAGGSFRGMVLYTFAGSLYFQAGNGSSFGQSTDRGEVSWSITDGIHVIEISGNTSTGKIALYIDGALIQVSSSFTTPNLSAGNQGALGGIDSNLPTNRGGFNDFPTDTHPAISALTPLLIFSDEITSDVL